MQGERREGQERRGLRAAFSAARTVSPKSENCGFFVPTTPESTSPLCSPMRTWIGVPSGCMKFVASSMQSIAIRTIARGWQPSSCNPPTAMYVAPTVSIFWTPCFSESSSNFDHTRSSSVTSSVGVSLATMVWNSMRSQKRTETSGSLSAMIVPVFFARRSVTCGGSMLSSIAFDFSRSSRSWRWGIGEWGVMGDVA